MSNNFQYTEIYLSSLDEFYRRGALTSILDGDPDTVEFDKRTGTFLVPTLTVQGLGDYDRAKGFPTGDATTVYNPYKLSFDRGRMFEVDVLDNIETAGIAFGKLANTFMKEQVIPEIDANRFATYISKADPSQIIIENFTDGKQVVKSLSDTSATLDDKEVAIEDRYLFITSTNYRAIQNMDSFASKAVLDSFAGVVQVPSSRFKTAIKLLDGTTEVEGGYEADASAKNINYLIVQKKAIIQYAKHIATKVITPEINPNKDAYKFGYRIAGVNEIYTNKTIGVAGSVY